MNSNAKALATALRSGEYRQAKRVLQVDGRFCCLGVACDLYVKEHPEVEGWKENENLVMSFDDGTYNAVTGVLPRNVQNWLGFSTCDGGFGGDIDTLTVRNDRGETFEEIAALIESEPKGLFVD